MHVDKSGNHVQIGCCVWGEANITRISKKKKKIKQSLLAALISNTELDEKRIDLLCGMVSRANCCWGQSDSLSFSFFLKFSAF